MNIFFKGKSRIKKKRTVSVGREYFELFAELLIFVFFINTFLLQLFVIPTPSMEGTLLIGDHLVVDKVAYANSRSRFGSALLPRVDIRRGMIVTFKAPPDMEKEYVKRVIGMPGDRLRVSGKKVWINGRPLAEIYPRFEAQADRSEFPPRDPFHWEPQFPLPLRQTRRNADGSVDYIVPPHHYFCMGDNRDCSFDSRFWGPVPSAYIIGKPWRIYWSIAADSEDYLTPGLIHKVKALAQTALRFFSRTRWERTVRAVE